MFLTPKEGDISNENFAIQLTEKYCLVEKWHSFYENEALFVATKSSCAVCAMEEVDGGGKPSAEQDPGTTRKKTSVHPGTDSTRRENLCNTQKELSGKFGAL
ncbi:hypothetical protein DPSP01_004817 [Paraphaeosphaeria sporulosa]